MKNTFIRFLIPVLLAGTAQLSCAEKEGGKKGGRPPAVVTHTVSGIAHFSADLNGEITDEGSPAYTERGVCWSPSPDPTTASEKRSESAQGAGNFQFHCDNMAASTLYYVRAYATNEKGTAYGEQITFTTAPPLNTPASVTTAAAASVTTSSAVLGGNVTAEGNPPHFERGVCYSMLEYPMRGGVGVTLPAGMAGAGSFTATAEGLYPGTTYYARAYTVASNGREEYGPQVSFTTAAGAGTKATLTTAAVTGIDTNMAVLGGSVTNVGSPACTERGICYNYAPTDPTVAEFKIPVDGSGTGSFSVLVEDIGYYTKIYVRSYAIGPWGIAYGDKQEFWAIQRDYTPSPTTNAVTDFSSTGAVFSGNMTDYNRGFPATTDYGFCYSTSTTPTVNNYVLTVPVGGTGTFSSAVSGLSPSTTYYVRAYARNRDGVGYGQQMSFTTATATSTSVPTAPVNVAFTGESLTSFKVHWVNTASNAASVVVERSSTGNAPWTLATTLPANSTSFGQAGMSSGTTYYYRVGAVNDRGTTYSPSVSFTTATAAPAVTSVGATYVGSVNANLTWEITRLGTPAYTGVGVRWGPTPVPSSGWQEYSQGSGPTPALEQLTTTAFGLTPGTTYYMQGFVSSAAGTVYGEVKSFTTLIPPALPGNLKVEMTGTNSVKVSWSVQAAGSYTYLQHSTDGSSWGGTVVCQPSSPAHMVYNGLAAGSTHYYRVCSRLDFQQSAYTAPVSITIPTPPAMTTTAERTAKNTFTLGGDITSAGSPAYTERGIMWYPDGQPDNMTHVKISGSGTGKFSVAQVLAPNEKRTVQAYVVINGVHFYAFPQGIWNY